MAYIFLDRFDHIPEQETQDGLRELIKCPLTDMIISWGHLGTPEDFYAKRRRAKAIARSDDPQFVDFYRANTNFDNQITDEKQAAPEADG